MGNAAEKKQKRNTGRHWVQLAYAAVTNGYAAGYLNGTLYKGNLKCVCVPGLNCYSCPGAFGSCPIGSLQAVVSSRNYGFSYYVVGFLLAFGAVLGRVVCGFLCPFGFVQELLYKIPFFKKLRVLPGDKLLRYLKYVILAAFVLLLPMLALDIAGQGQPWFCKYICPSGTLFAGLPLVLTNQSLQAAAGGLFAWKVGLMLLILLLCIPVYRPFCRYLCPLGAIYGLFNPVALYRYRVDASACTRCGACEKSCPMAVATYLTPNSPECIRCGACRRVCPTGAIHSTLERTAKNPRGERSAL
ncbi:MAG TPA: 4Fe-4S binding protein [Feifaniaceae bacterium]|nr:4Fe-4S binding protein [Feifaniaceae bacterium]